MIAFPLLQIRIGTPKVRSTVGRWWSKEAKWRAHRPHERLPKQNEHVPDLFDEIDRLLANALDARFELFAHEDQGRGLIELVV